jgi:hypothetical protein
VVDQLRDMAAKAMLHEAEAQRLAQERAALEAAQAKQREEDEARARRHREEDEARAARQREDERAQAAREQQALQATEAHLHQLRFLRDAHAITAVNANAPALETYLKRVQAQVYPDPLRDGIQTLNDEVREHLREQLGARIRDDEAAAKEAQRKREAAAELMRAADPWRALAMIRHDLKRLSGMVVTDDDVDALLKIVDDVLAAREAVQPVIVDLTPDVAAELWRLYSEPMPGKIEALPPSTWTP